MKQLIKKPAYVVTVLLILLLVGGVAVISGTSTKEATLTVEVVPSGSHLKVNSKNSSGGKLSVPAGSVTLVTSRNNFQTDTRVVAIKKGESKYVGIVLKPNEKGPDVNWYETHPKDQKKAEGISSKNSDQIGQDIVAAGSLISNLPYVDLQFRVDYGIPTRSADKNRPALFIKGLHPMDRQLALDWIRQQNVDPSDYEIHFVNMPEAFEGY